MELNARLQQLLAAEKVKRDADAATIAAQVTALAALQAQLDAIEPVTQATIDLVASEEQALSITVGA